MTEVDEVDELLIHKLLFAVQLNKNGVISAEDAASVVGAENVERLRHIMSERKWLMNECSRIKNGFQLTMKGLKVAMKLIAAETEADGYGMNTAKVMAKLKELQGPPELPKPWTAEQPLKVYPGRDRYKTKAFLLPPGDSLYSSWLINSVPSTWQRMYGVLKAPASLIEAGEASAHGGYYLGSSQRYWKSDQDTSPRNHEEREQTMIRARVDILDMLERHKLPGFIEFDDAGAFGHGHQLPFASLQAIIVAYLQRGYTGELRLCRDDVTSDRYLESVTIHFSQWEENDFGMRTNRPPVIIINWKDQDRVESILKACMQQGLEPVPTVVA